MEEDFQGGDKVLNEIGLGLKMTKKYENGKKKSTTMTVRTITRMKARCGFDWFQLSVAAGGTNLGFTDHHLCRDTHDMIIIII